MTLRRILGLTTVLILLFSLSVTAAEPGKFSFSVFGDSRLPGNMNFTKDQQGSGGEIDKYIQANFIGKTIADCVLRFNKVGQLSGLRVPASGSPYKDITFDGKGWPARIINSAQTPQLTLLEGGQSWVYRSVIESVKKAGSEGFALHTGDISYNGYYGTSPETSVYWNDFKTRFIDLLPAGAPSGLFGRFYPAVGNHETWLDPEMQGLRNTLPYLENFNVSAEHHIYAFDTNGSRFIFLDTGGYNPPAGWGDDSQPGYDEQMKQLKAWLNNVQAKGIKQVFISLHKPPFCKAGHGHLDAKQNIHDTLKPFATDKDQPLSITVFSGHVHSSEFYYKDKVRYMVLGGGGADQVYSTIPCEKSDPYCQGERYWRDQPRVMEFNYLDVAVDGDDVSFKLNRWRPDSATPYESCLIDKQMNISGCE